MLSRCAKPGLLVSVLLLCSARDVFAYLPIECISDSVKDDFKESALIVIGRVTSIERYRTRPPDQYKAKRDANLYFYVATITVGRTLKGDAKVGQEILFFMGFSSLRDDDNLHSRILVVANTHSGWDLDVDNAYLLCLRSSEYLQDKARAEVRRDGAWHSAGLEKRAVWEPRSCHNSVHRVSGRDPVLVSLGLEHPRSRPESRVPLEEFIAAQKKGQFPGKPHEPPAPREPTKKAP